LFKSHPTLFQEKQQYQQCSQLTGA
jgi:hypothetical protein